MNSNREQGRLEVDSATTFHSDVDPCEDYVHVEDPSDSVWKKLEILRGAYLHRFEHLNQKIELRGEDVSKRKRSVWVARLITYGLIVDDLGKLLNSRNEVKLL